MVFYQLMTGKLPQGDFPPPSKMTPGIDAGVDTAVMRALANDPELRFGEVKELIAAIKENQGTKKAGGRGTVTAVTVTTLVAVLGMAFWLQPWKTKETVSLSPIVNPAQGDLSTGNSSVQTEPPFALAEMRKRGGKVRAWSPDNPEEIAKRIEPASDFDNWVQLKSSNGKTWAALNRTGRLIHLTNRSGQTLVEEGGSSFGISPDGSFAYCGMDGRFYGKRNFRIEELSSGPFVGMSVGHSHAYGIGKDGSVQIFPLSAEMGSNSGYTSIETLLRERRDILWIVTHVNHSLAATRTGEILRWDIGKGHWYPPETEIPEAVEAAYTDSGVLVLDRFGAVHYLSGATNSPYSVPVDLPPVYAIRFGGGMVAAQIEDGSWVT